VLDFTDRHNNLDILMSLESVLPEAAHVVEEFIGTNEEIDRSAKIEVLREVDKEFDILGAARFIWTAIGDDEWSLIDDNKNEIIMYPKDEKYVATLYFSDGNTRQIVTSPLPLDYCSGVCEDFARRNLEIAFADMSKPWMCNSAKPTQGQTDYLERQGIDCSGMNRGQASKNIRQIIALKNKQRRLLSNEPITLKQKYLLNQYGVNTANMTKLKAIQIISQIKQKAVNF